MKNIPKERLGLSFITEHTGKEDLPSTTVSHSGCFLTRRLIVFPPRYPEAPVAKTRGLREAEAEYISYAVFLVASTHSEMQDTWNMRACKKPLRLRPLYGIVVGNSEPSTLSQQERGLASG